MNMAICEAANDWRKKASFAILAGGASSRMGKDKAFLPFLGVPLIECVIERGRAICDEVFIITNQPEPYRYLNLPLFPDALPIKGPLIGLYTALLVTQTPYLILAGCDMPFISLPILNDLLQKAEAGKADIVIPRRQHGLEPLHAVYRREPCLPVIERALAVGERSLIRWFGNLTVCEVPDDLLWSLDRDRRAFDNLNTPEEFESAEVYAAGSIHMGWNI